MDGTFGGNMRDPVIHACAGALLALCLTGCGARTATLAFYEAEQAQASDMLTPQPPQLVVGASPEVDLEALLPPSLIGEPIEPLTGALSYEPVTDAGDSLMPYRPDVRFYTVPLQRLEPQGESLVAEAPRRNPWDIAHAQLAQAHKALGEQAFVVFEPDITLIDSNQSERYRDQQAEAVATLKQANEQSENSESLASGDTVVVGPTKVWPVGEPFWHKGDNYSQLTRAAKRVGEQLDNNRSGVVIAQLDTGYRVDDAYRPDKLDQSRSYSFTGKGRCGAGNEGGGISDEDTPGHGQRMLSLLAGPAATIEGVTDTLGGDPYASIRVYRIAESWPVHFSTRRMTAAIDCAREEGVDVISMSAGGLPSIAQRNAVNAAYDEGVAIFAATGDFFHIPFTNIKLLGESTVFPARYTRVIGVAGATAEHDSYGDSPSYWKLAAWPVKPLLSRFGNWMLRGSFGPESVMAGHTVAGYSPNIDHGFSVNNQKQVRRNGAGTSSSTPQAAAAASLWLAQEEAAIREAGHWRSWQKTEAVYQAMLQAAANAAEADARYQDKARFGEGPVKASDMLDIRYAELTARNLEAREESRIGYLWLLQTLESSGMLSAVPPARTAQLDMLLTEAMQVVETSSRARRAFAKVRACEAARQECADLKKKVVKQLLKKERERLSETLKAHLKEALKEAV